MDRRAAFIVANIMSDSLAQARTFGTDSVLATHFWTTVKTDTSKDMRDNWVMGFSQRYTVGVWLATPATRPLRPPDWFGRLRSLATSLKPATVNGLWRALNKAFSLLIK